MTQCHHWPEIGQGLRLHMRKVLSTPMRPSKSVFLGYSAHLWLNVGNDAIYCTPKGYYIIPSENHASMPFENVIIPLKYAKMRKLCALKHRRHANHLDDQNQSKQTKAVKL